jgi:hypothetical protein
VVLWDTDPIEKEREMSERTSYEPGTPCWVELGGTPDIEAA